MTGIIMSVHGRRRADRWNWKERYSEKMGFDLGQVFHHLMQEVAFLHLKWNEYRNLFDVSPEQMALLNRAAPGFFWLIEDA